MMAVRRLFGYYQEIYFSYSTGNSIVQATVLKLLSYLKHYIQTMCISCYEAGFSILINLKGK